MSFSTSRSQVQGVTVPYIDDILRPERRRGLPRVFRHCLAFPAHIAVLCDPKVRKTNLFARRSTGKGEYVGRVKRVLGCRISPEDGEAEKLAREQPDRLAEKMRRSAQELTERTAGGSHEKEG